MINRHLLQNEDEPSTIEKLLEPSRITINYEKLIKDAGNKELMNAEVLVEPFEMKLGFRELEFFKKLNEQFQAFMVVINGTG